MSIILKNQENVVTTFLFYGVLETCNTRLTST